MKLLQFYRRTSLFLGVMSVALVTVTSLADCKGVDAPSPAQIEAGEPVAEGVCTLIENQTGSVVLETICASLPEIATIAATILALRADSGVPTAAEVCKPLPRTELCATPREIHAGIVAVVAQRRARLLIDAGMQ